MKRFAILGLGVLAGSYLADRWVLPMTGVGVSEGEFGTDDFISAATIAATIILLDRFI